MRTKEEYIPFGEDHPGALKIRERLPFLLILKWAQEKSKGYAETIREMFEEYGTFPFEDETELNEFDETTVEMYFITNGHELLNSMGGLEIENPDMTFPFPDLTNLDSISFIVGEEFVSRLDGKAKAEDLTREAILNKITKAYDIRRRAA